VPRTTCFLHIDILYILVSKEAIMFGCGGLLTGALIGICVGYTVRSGSSASSQFSNGGSNNYIMRAILSTSSRRGIDVSSST
jgi:hypothetical protein